MGKISECIYATIDPSVCSVRDAGEFYFLQNVSNFHDMFIKAYEEYETKHTKIRNTAIRKSIPEDGSIHPKMSSVIFGTSATKNKVVAVVEV